MEAADMTEVVQQLQAVNDKLFVVVLLLCVLLGAVLGICAVKGLNKL